MSAKSVRLSATIALAFLLLSRCAFAYQDPAAEDSLDRELAISKNEILENRDTSRMQAISANVRWPTSRPTTGYRSARFSWFGQQFDFYIWVEQGELWAQVVPIGSAPFVCSSSFVVIQNGVQYDTLKLETISGSSQCGNLYISSVFLVTQWSFYTRKANLASDFTLVLDTAAGVQKLDVIYENSNTGTTPTPNPSSGYVNSLLDIWVPSIIFQRPAGPMDIYLKLEFYGETTDGDLLWRLSDYGPNL